MGKIDKDKLDQTLKAVNESKEMLKALRERANEIGALILKEFKIKKKVRSSVPSLEEAKKLADSGGVIPLRGLGANSGSYWSCALNEWVNSKSRISFKPLKTGGHNYQKSFPAAYLFMTNEKIREDVQDNIKNGAKLAAIRRQRLNQEIARKAKVAADALAKLSAEERRLLRVRVPKKKV